MGLFSKKGGGKLAYKYYLSWHSVLCLGQLDSVRKVIFDDDKVVYDTVVTDNTTININKQSAFGGLSSSGGVSGNVDVMFGKSTQAVNPNLKSLLDPNNTGLLPAFRGVTSLFFRNFYVGTSPYIKSMAILGTRINTTFDGSAQWYGEKATINELDMNPIHIIREVLTSKHPKWGVGMSTADIDDDNFKACADVLYNEGFGLSFNWNDDKSASEFLTSVYEHIDAIPSKDRKTGKFKLRLVRNDYDYANLRILNENEISEVVRYSKGDFESLYNEVKVEYWDRERNQTGTVPVSNPALYNTTGYVNSKTIKYEGCCVYSLANKMAIRELRSLSSALVTIEVKCNRLAFDLENGDLVRVNLVNDEYQDVAYRIVKISYDESCTYVNLTLLEDIFGQPATVTGAPVEHVITNTLNPSAITTAKIYELNRRDLLNIATDSEITALGTTQGIVGFSAVNESINSGYVLQYLVQNYVDSALVDTYLTSADTFYFNELYKLSTAMTKTTTEIQISGLSAVPNNYIEIDNERMIITAYNATTGMFTVLRGVQDTHPATHAVNATVTLIDYVNVFDDRTYTSGQVAKFKLITYLNNKQLDTASAPQVTYTTTARQAKPLPPKNIKINNAYQPTLTGNSAVITFSKRSFTNDNLSWYTTEGVTTNYTYYVSYKHNNQIKTAELKTTNETIALVETSGFNFTFWSELNGVKSAEYVITV